MDQRIVSLYNRFTHGGMSRRDFLGRPSELAGSAVAAAALLPSLQNDYAKAAIVADSDKRYTLHTYPGTQHAFNNDTGAARYNKEAADLAWSRTVAFFRERLGAPPRAA